MEEPDGVARSCSGRSAEVKALVIGRFELEPGERDGKPGYRFRGKGTLDSLLEGVITPHITWRPQRDSVPLATFAERRRKPEGSWRQLPSEGW